MHSYKLALFLLVAPLSLTAQAAAPMGRTAVTKAATAAHPLQKLLITIHHSGKEKPTIINSPFIGTFEAISVGNGDTITVQTAPDPNAKDCPADPARCPRVALTVIDPTKSGAKGTLQLPNAEVAGGFTYPVVDLVANGGVPIQINDRIEIQATFQDETFLGNFSYYTRVSSTGVTAPVMYRITGAPAKFTLANLAPSLAYGVRVNRASGWYLGLEGVFTAVPLAQSNTFSTQVGAVMDVDSYLQVGGGYDFEGKKRYMIVATRLEQVLATLPGLAPKH